jgi:phosphopantothenoylcysteine decarboxylase/phosphopantothenate--cysteine ligase
VRRLRERGAEVRVAMTEAAKAFITPLACRRYPAIRFPTACSMAEAAMGHIELGKWADLVILAPATADLIARVAAGGMANDLCRRSVLPPLPRLPSARHEPADVSRAGHPA